MIYLNRWYFKVLKMSFRKIILNLWFLFLTLSSHKHLLKCFFGMKGHTFWKVHFRPCFLRDWWSRKEMFLWDKSGSLKTINKSWANWLLKALYRLFNLWRSTNFLWKKMNLTVLTVLCLLWPSFVALWLQDCCSLYLTIPEGVDPSPICLSKE